MNVEVVHLRVLVALADEGSFTAAADALGVSQAAISRRLAALEHELAVRLVHRTTRRVELSEAGASFAAEARRILRRLDDVVGAHRGDPTTIRLGYAWAALGAHTTRTLRTWNRTHPHEPIRMHRHNSVDAGLAAGLVDLAVLRHDLHSPEYTQVDIGSEPRLCALAVDHRLAERSTLHLAELLDETVAVDRVTGTTGPELWIGTGLPAAPRTLPTSDIEEWVDLIAAGDAVGVTAAATAFQYPRPGVVYLPIVDAPPVTVRMVGLRGFPHPSTARLARHLTAMFAARPLVGGAI